MIMRGEKNQSPDGGYPHALSFCGVYRPSPTNFIYPNGKFRFVEEEKNV